MPARWTRIVTRLGSSSKAMRAPYVWGLCFYFDYNARENKFFSRILSHNHSENMSSQIKLLLIYVFPFSCCFKILLLKKERKFGVKLCCVGPKLDCLTSVHEIFSRKELANDSSDRSMRWIKDAPWLQMPTFTKKWKISLFQLKVLISVKTTQEIYCWINWF